MAKVRTMQSSLNSGEISPKLHGRPDLPRFANGLELCHNMIPMVTGGATRRGGTRHVTNTIYPGWLMPFTTSLNGPLTGYVLEMRTMDADTCSLRIYSQRAQLMDGMAEVTVALPYRPSEIEMVHYEQFDDVLHFFHGSYAPHRLVRTSDTEWTVEPVPIEAFPFMRPPGTSDRSITPSALSGDITLLASAPVFLPEHVGLRFMVNGGILNITAVADSLNASATVVGAIIPEDGVSKITAVTTLTPLVIPGGEGDPGSLPIATTMTVTSVAELDKGTLQVTGYQANWEIITEYSTAQLTGLEPDPNWKEQAWSELRGWPSTAAFADQRLNVSGTRTYPRVVFGSKNIESKNGSIFNFTIGTLDNEGYAFTPAAATTAINHLVAADQLMAFTEKRELIMTGGNDSTITPTNIRIRPRTFYGSSRSVRPALAGSDVFFASVSGKRWRMFQYQVNEENYVGQDMSILAEHFFEAGGIRQVVYAAEPWNAFFLVTTDYRLLTFTYSKEQQVMAWAHQFGDGTENYQSVTVIPTADGTDQVWLNVKRGEHYCVEILDDTLNTDSAVTGTDPVGKKIWAGLDHLEGVTVDIVADEYVVPAQVVTDGAVVLPFAAKEVEIGRHYTSTVKDLPLSLYAGTVVLGAAMSVNRLAVQLYKSKGCVLNGDRVPFREYGNAMDNPVPAFTGLKYVDMIGWADDSTAAQTTIVQDLPLPLTVLSIIREVTING